MSDEIAEPLDTARRVPMEASRAFYNARYWARLLQKEGIRQSHGIGPACPLTPAQRREVALIERAVTRLYAVDARLFGEYGDRVRRRR